MKRWVIKNRNRKHIIDAIALLLFAFMAWLTFIY